MLFKSLRERILVFFSLLIIGLQAVSFTVVSKNAADADAARAHQQNLFQQRVVGQIIEARYALMDATLAATATRLAANFDTSQAQSPTPVLDIAANELPGFDWSARGSALLVLDSAAGKVSLLPGDQSFSAAEQALLNRAGQDFPNGSQRSSLLVGDRYYLVAYHKAGAFSLAIAEAIDASVARLIFQSLGARLHVQNNGPAESPHRVLDNTLLPKGLLHNVSLSLESKRGPVSPELQRQKNILMLLMAVALLITLLGGYALADELTRPLKALIKTADQIKSGDYNLPHEEFQQDEIGQLANTLSHMCTTISEREQKIIALAYADSLTHLPNRALFDDRLSRAVSQGMRGGGHFSVALLDLDRFKYINDVLGHEAGDFVLCEVAKRLESVLREADTVARLGGDEFALLLRGDNQYHIQKAINKVQEVFEEPVILDEQQLDIACSIGIARFPEHGEDASILLRRADMAMYAAKRFNAGFSYYTTECDQHQEEHLSLLGDIKRAIENDELKLYYQPKVSFEADDQIAVETLLRWQHPRRGLIPPQEFIPFAEQTGAIRLITRWLLVHAMRQCGEWHKQGLNIQMSLNISARDLVDPDFPALVSDAIEKNSVPVSFICLEITESALMQDPAKARRTIEVLSEMGIKMSIDDYGTGYSSLAYVKNLRVNELKIDREFVSNMVHNDEDSAIVKSTIELGHNLGMRVVAEGIEHSSEMDLLRSFGCDQAQGFLISHALDANELESWYENRDEEARQASEAAKLDDDSAGKLA